MTRVRTKKVIFTGLCIGIGILLPELVNIIPISYPGSIFLPMHIPVILCGFICGKYFGAVSGVITPLLSFLLTGMPPIFPTGISMVFELATYGFLSAMMFNLTKGNVFVSLITAMIGGRIIMGITNILLFNFANNTYGISVFMSSAFITALPGIVIQLILIPVLMQAFIKAKLIPIHDSATISRTQTS